MRGGTEIPAPEAATSLFVGFTDSPRRQPLLQFTTLEILSQTYLHFWPTVLWIPAKLRMAPSAVTEEDFRPPIPQAATSVRGSGFLTELQILPTKAP